MHMENDVDPRLPMFFFISFLSLRGWVMVLFDNPLIGLTYKNEERGSNLAFRGRHKEATFQHTQLHRGCASSSH